MKLSPGTSFDHFNFVFISTKRSENFESVTMKHGDTQIILFTENTCLSKNL